MKVPDKTSRANPKKEPPRLKVILSLEPKLGRAYANYVQVSHSQYDFTIRFGDGPPGVDVPRLRQGDTITIPNIAEIIVSPEIIPGIIGALDSNYKKFLKKFRDAAKKD
ncbi:MAG: DUF3467 domain-containing protein [Desulfobaccales bacterium]